LKPPQKAQQKKKKKKKKKKKIAPERGSILFIFGGAFPGFRSN
jgi:hypothetical protein